MHTTHYIQRFSIHRFSLMFQCGVLSPPAGHWQSCTDLTTRAVTYVPVTRRNFKLSSFSVMAASFGSLPASCNNKWYYTREQIDNNPSKRAGLDPDKELSYRQQAANLLQDMGQRLNVYLLSEERLAFTLACWLASLACWLANFSFPWSRFGGEHGCYLLLCLVRRFFSLFVGFTSVSSGGLWFYNIRVSLQALPKSGVVG